LTARNRAGTFEIMIKHSLTAGLAVAGLLVTAAPADAATVQDLLTPERLALVDPQQVTGATPSDRPSWAVTTQRTGSLPGRPGNRHDTLLSLDPDSLGPGTPTLQVDIHDRDCADGGACTTLQRISGRTAVQPGTTYTVGAAAHLVVRVDDATPGLTITRAPGVPATPLEADVTITPNPSPLPPLAMDNLDVARRVRTTASDTYAAGRHLGLRRATAEGTAFGVALAAGDSASTGWGAGRTLSGPGLPLVRTAAERRPWLPVTEAGVNSGVTADRTGLLRGTPVTSGGNRFPGNRHRLTSSLRVGSEFPVSATAAVESRTCAEGQAWADCTPTDVQVRLTQTGTPQVVRGRDGAYAATVVLGVAPGAPGEPPPADPQAWGTIRLSLALAPGRVGVPRDSIEYWRTGIPFVTRNETLMLSRTLRYAAGDAEASAPVSVVVLGTAPVQPWRTGDVDQVTYFASGQASGPPVAPCCPAP
jgi:hypothetical protein